MTGGGIGVGRLARQVRGKYIKQTQAIASSIEKYKGTYRVYPLMYRCFEFFGLNFYRTCSKSFAILDVFDRSAGRVLLLIRGTTLFSLYVYTFCLDAQSVALILDIPADIPTF